MTTDHFKPEDLTSGDRPLAIPSELPILPLRDTVLFPNSFMPLAVARESSVRLIDDAMKSARRPGSVMFAASVWRSSDKRGESETTC